MATERDTSGQAGLVRRSAGVVKTAFDSDASPPERRRALLKTIGVGSVAVLGPIAGTDALINNPGILHTLTLPLSNPDVLTGGIGFAAVALVGGGISAVGNQIDVYSPAELKSLTRTFSGIRTAGYAVGGVLCVSALALAGAGTEHLLGDGVAIGSLLGVGAAGAGAAGAGAHMVERFWARRLPAGTQALGE